MTTTLRAERTRPALADTPTGLASGSPVGADLPPDPSRDYFPSCATPTLVLLDVQLFTRPPDGAETLSEVVRRVAG